MSPSVSRFLRRDQNIPLECGSALDDSERQTEPIEYARRGAEVAPKTRVIIQSVDGGVRYIDPPVGWKSNTYAIAVAVAGTAMGIVFVILFIPRAPTDGQAVRLMFWGLLVIGFAWMTINSWLKMMRVAQQPTIVEVSNGCLSLVTPRDGLHRWKAAEVSYVHAGSPRAARTGRRVSSLQISVRGRTYRILEHRNYVEVKWLAKELRRTMGMPEQDIGEPPALLEWRTLEEEVGDHPPVKRYATPKMRKIRD